MVGDVIVSVEEQTRIMNSTLYFSAHYFHLFVMIPMAHYLYSDLCKWLGFRRSRRRPIVSIETQLKKTVDQAKVVDGSL